MLSPSFSQKLKNILFLNLIIVFCSNLYAQFNNDLTDDSKVYADSQPKQPLPTSSEFFTNLTNIKLLGSSSNQISTEPNESINLFTGVVNRTYKEVSIPVAPGLNMEFIRSYSSNYYSDQVFRIERSINSYLV